MKKILILLLSLFVFVGCSPNNLIISSKNYSLPTYYHYEPNDFYKNCDILASYIEQNDCEKALDMYDKLYKDTLEISDLSSICFVNYSENINDDFYSEEHQYIENLYDELKNDFLTLCHMMTQSNFAEDFKNHIENDELYDDYFDYKEKTDEEIELFAEEIKLEQEFYQINDSLDDYTYSYNGKEYTYDEIIDISSSDYQLFSELYKGINYKINNDLGEIYLKLVKVRDKIAKFNGYDNYALYADTELYCRDYSAEDLSSLKEVTKEYGDDIIYLLYNYYDYGSNNITGDKLFDDVMSIAKNISPLTNNSFRVLSDYNLHSISYGDGRYDGSYETSFSLNNSAFIFLNLSNTFRDYFTLAHEFGHFTNAINFVNNFPLTRDGCYDVLEIHSSGLEVLFGEKASSIFENNYDISVMSNIIEFLSAIVDACVYDDFQRYVYENPNITLDEVNSIFKKILYDYGWDTYDGYLCMEYDWMHVPHNFDSPMYYISYGTSYYASLQIWSKCLDNFDDAVKIWEKIVQSDCYSNGYIDIVTNAGLLPFTDKDSVINTYNNTINYIYSYFSIS